MYPSGVWTDEAVRVVSEMVYGGSGRYVGLPTRYVAIGARVRLGDRVYECLERSRVDVPEDACRGCAFRNGRPACGDLQCSRWDRADGKNVWFGRVERKGD